MPMSSATPIQIAHRHIGRGVAIESAANPRTRSSLLALEAGMAGLRGAPMPEVTPVTYLGLMPTVRGR
jgi:hypothetical protein